MKLLLNDKPLIILPALAKQVGLNEAIFLQQLHFRSLCSSYEQRGFKWVCKTLAEWEQEFGFWSGTTIRRIITSLEKQNFICSSSAFNKMKIDKTKWYRVNYSQFSGANDPQCATNSEASNELIQKNENGQNEQQLLTELDRPITKECKEKDKNKYIVGHYQNVIQEIIEYLNERTGKQFKASSAPSSKLIIARLKEGYTIDDFKRVIDNKTSQWKNDAKYSNYLRPSTLFNATNFENYMNEQQRALESKKAFHYQPPVLDFTKGERKR